MGWNILSKVAMPAAGQGPCLLADSGLCQAGQVQGQSAV